MQIADITKLAGAHKRRKRVGRGSGSGYGKTSTRGHNGGGSRSGWRTRGLAEGGQMPLFRRLPKRGFNNFNFRTEFSIVNVSDLEARFDVGALVNGPSLVEVGLIRNMKQPIKVLGNGELTKKLVVEADRFSKQAVQKIESAGGETRWLRPMPEPKRAKSQEPPAKSSKQEQESKSKGKSKSKAPAAEDAASTDSPADVGAEE